MSLEEETKERDAEVALNVLWFGARTWRVVSAV
jgi:hypothetical protein